MAAVDPLVLAVGGLLILIVVGVLVFMPGGKAKFLKGAKERQQLEVGEKVFISHDTVRLRFVLPKATPVLGLPIGKHFKIYAPLAKVVTPKKAGEWNGREDMEQERTEIERKYTPTTSDDEVGYVDLVIKVYKGGVVDRFPDGGKMSQYLGGLKPGDKVDVTGPVGTHTYLGNGKFKSGTKEHTCKKLGMMAGGTGLTPMLQVIAAVLKNPADPTQLYLIYANQTEGDILCREMLEDLQKAHPKRLKIWYTLDRPPKKWAYGEGFITEEMIAEHLPGPKESSLILMCGPPPMVKFACQQNLDKLGYKKDVQIAF
jgi:cytochrome-b5 reductase